MDLETAIRIVRACQKPKNRPHTMGEEFRDMGKAHRILAQQYVRELDAKSGTPADSEPAPLETIRKAPGP